MVSPRFKLTLKVHDLCLGDRGGSISVFWVVEVQSMWQKGRRGSKVVFGGYRGSRRFGGRGVQDLRAMGSREG